jgi:RsiW-degrading membrane proteinase PrsW (M82 family)
MKKTYRIILCAVLLILLAAGIVSLPVQGRSPLKDDLALAELFAPVLYFHLDEVFRPQPVEVLVNHARLRQNVKFWLDVNILNEVTLSDLVTYYNTNYFLDVWYGSRGLSDYKNYSAHRDYYTQNLSPTTSGLPVTAYAHVIRDQDHHKIVIQYWLFYYYNDWFNKHEGDWELIQVILDQNEQPEWIVLSQHHGGTRRAWADATIEDKTHPVVYVASGSHANYFWRDEIYPNGMDIGDTRVEILDRTGSADPTIPEIQLLPERQEVLNRASTFPLLEWLVFSGNWGETAFQGDFSGPLGPAEKGEQWEQAYQWGIDQPLDSDVWYQNRLRVEVTGDGAESARITILDGSLELSNAEQGTNPAILHQDPAEGSEITANISGVPIGPAEILVVQPIPQTEVSQYTFDLDISDQAEPVQIRIPAAGPPSLALPSGEMVAPTSVTSIAATWDAPDLVWFAGYLPAGQVLLGVLQSLAAGILPGLVYATALYWIDRYEKEPLRLLSAVLLWGAIPAVTVALVAQMFFQLPPDLTGPKAIEALQAGVLTPLIEELLKGAVVLVVAFRFRQEFDNVLDGVIYGSMVGFGYAMTGNTISFLGAFLLHGFGGLGMTLIIEGFLFGLNHAMYTAIFGAGLGYARLSKPNTVKFLIPIGTFLLAVAANASHSLVVNKLVGLNAVTVAIQWLGVSLIVLVSMWSLRRQREVLITELRGEISTSELGILLDKGLKRKKLQAARKTGGRKAVKRLHQRYQLLAEYAFKKDQARRFPQENLTPVVNALKAKINKSEENLP